ncbi:hypothetical protein FRC09_002748 [Ceratobasidium sp. 395]|nr:hypothetical protein FRC09_002748 [Ceratobasidium sp. 395]
MALAEAGMFHRDITAFNTLLVNPNTYYVGTNKDWKRPVKESLGNLVWDSLWSEPLPDIESDATDAPNGRTGTSRKRLAAE